MANKYETVMRIRAFLNDKGVAKWGNGKWKPFRDGSEADINLRAGETYSVSVFENDNGSIDINLSRRVEYTGTDNLGNDVSQGGFKKVADTMAAKQAASLSLEDDDDVPF
jgi:hypothetical protein